MSDNEDNVLDAKQWEKEAAAIINDVQSHVREIFISTELPTDNSRIYLNLRTLEGLRYCVEVSAEGFTVCGTRYDAIATVDNSKRYETVYSLLDELSRQYRDSFAGELIEKLAELSKTDDVW